MVFFAIQLTEGTALLIDKLPMLANNTARLSQALTSSAFAFNNIHMNATLYRCHKSASYLSLLFIEYSTAFNMTKILIKHLLQR